MTKDITVLLNEYADIRESLTGEFLFTLVGVGWEARARRGFIDLYDALLKVEQQQIASEGRGSIWKWLVESNRVWWGVYGLLILALVLASITDLIVFWVVWLLLAVVLGILLWLKYGRGR